MMCYLFSHSEHAITTDPQRTEADTGVANDSTIRHLLHAFQVAKQIIWGPTLVFRFEVLEYNDIGALQSFLKDLCVLLKPFTQ